KPSMEYSNYNFVANYTKTLEFSPGITYSFTATIVAYQYMPDKSLKEVMRQDTLVKFKTKAADSRLSDKQLAYIYPINGQRYFLKGEFGGKGFIRLKELPRMERIPLNNPQYRRIIQFLPANQTADTVSIDFQWNPTAQEQITFAIPGELKLNSGYRMNLLAVPADAVDRLQQEMQL